MIPRPVEVPYDRAMRRLCEKVSADTEWAQWWSRSGYYRLLPLISQVPKPEREWFRPRQIEDIKRRMVTAPNFHFVADGSGLIVNAEFKDISIGDEKKPTRERLAEVTTEHVREILRGTGSYLKIDPPEWRF
jgi:hypothetical protein